MCVRSLFVTVHLASPGAGIDVTLEFRGAGEGDRGSQKASLLLCTCLSPPFSPRLHADLCRLPLSSANLDQFPPRTPFCFLAPVECEEAQGAPEQRLRGPGVVARGMMSMSGGPSLGCHLECITASVVNYTLISSNRQHCGSSF